MTLPGLPQRVEAGLVVAAGPTGPRGCTADRTCPLSTATFDQVSLSAAGSGQAWRSVDVGRPWSPAGSFTESGGVFTVKGGGDFRPFSGFDPNIADGTLMGLLIGLPVLIAVGVLFGASEYARGLHRITLAATPRRRRVLAAKAIVLGGTVLVVEFLATAASFVWLVSNVEATGIAPIEYLHPAVVKAVLGTTAILLAVALSSLAARHADPPVGRWRAGPGVAGRTCLTGRAGVAGRAPAWPAGPGHGAGRHANDRPG